MSSALRHLVRGCHQRLHARALSAGGDAAKSAAVSTADSNPKEKNKKKDDGSQDSSSSSPPSSPSSSDAAAGSAREEGSSRDKDGKASRVEGDETSGAAAASAAASARGGDGEEEGAVPGTAGAAAEDAARAAKAAAEGFGTWAKNMGAKLNDAGARAAAGAKVPNAPKDSFFGAVVDAFKEEYRLAMMDPGDAAAERRKQQPGYVAPGPVEEYHGTTAVAMSQKKKTTFQKGWDAFAEKTGFTTVFSKLESLKQTPTYKKGEETLEDIRERWETSDNPVVHRIQDFQDNLFTETEQAEAYKVIRQRQPAFNINDFLAEVRRDVPKVLGAYLKGDLESLAATNVSKEMLERMGGQMKLWQHEGQFVDPRVLHLSDLELVEVRMMEGEPLVVLQFSCQQINCVRNELGEIVDGAEDDIQAVHYLWAMQLSNAQHKTEDGREYTAPTWQLREMVLRGMMAIV